MASAAFSVRGSRVLHIDGHEHYGAESASLSLSQYEKSPEVLAGRSEFSDQYVISLGKRFSLDISPGFLFAKDELVDTLISSGVSDHLSFTGIAKIYFRRNEIDSAFFLLPFSKAEVFQSKDLTVFEKRNLMKFLTSELSGFSLDLQTAAIVGRDKYHEVNDLPSLDHSISYNRYWLSYLSEKGVSDKLQDMISFGLCGFTGRNELRNASCQDGKRRIERFARSLGRFSEKSAILYPNYGMGELSQAFARKSAVHGGLFALNCSSIDWQVEAKLVTTSTGDLVSAENFIQSEKDIPGKVLTIIVKSCENQVFDTNSLLVSTFEEFVIFGLFIDHLTNCVPEGYKILHVWSIEGSLNDMRQFSNEILCGNEICFTSSHDGLFDYSKAVSDAKGMFHSQWPF